MKKLKDLVRERINIQQDILEILDKLETGHSELLKSMVVERTLLKNYENPEFFEKNTAEERYNYIEEIAMKNTLLADIQNKIDGLSIIREKKHNVENLCPISLQPIITPWTSVCGHVFEEKSIFEDDRSLRIKACPIIGCGAKLLQKSDES